jgi:hypothetical protein
MFELEIVTLSNICPKELRATAGIQETEGPSSMPRDPWIHLGKAAGGVSTHKMYRKRSVSSLSTASSVNPLHNQPENSVS